MAIESAVVLAAGEGTRLRPLTKYRPKPMLPAANRPILEYVLDSLVDAGIEDLHLVVGYERDRVQSHFGPSYRGQDISYHVQRKQLGSGHALLQAREAIDDEFLVVNGDEVTAADMVRAVVDAHDSTRLATLAVVESEEAPQYGAVRLRGDRVEEFIEKPQQGDYRLLNAGVYAFSETFFELIDETPRESGELGISEVITRAIHQGETIYGVRTRGFRSEATYPWDLTQLAARLLARGSIDEPEIEPGIYVAESARIHSDATLRAPLVVGPDSVVGPNAVVGPDVALGRNTTVEANTTIERTVIDDDTRIGAGTQVFDSVTGQGADIGAGVTVPRGPSDVMIGTRVHENERLGCVVADRAELGGGVTVSPGALVGPEAVVAPGGFVRGNVDEGSEVTR